MEITLRTQPIPRFVAEACAWLSAAERYDSATGWVGLRQRLAAGDALDALLDVEPPYEPIDTSKPAMPLVEVAGAVTAALERALRMDGQVEWRLGIARALRIVRQALI